MEGVHDRGNEGLAGQGLPEPGVRRKHQQRSAAASSAAVPLRVGIPVRVGIAVRVPLAVRQPLAEPVRHALGNAGAERVPIRAGVPDTRHDPVGDRVAVPVVSVAIGPTVPSREDPFLRGASELVGGPLGRHARAGRGRATLPLLLLLTAVTCLFGWVQKSPCLSHPWTHEYQYTRLCYSDVFALYYSEKLVEGRTPYADVPVEYPVVIGGMMAVASEVAQQTPVDGRNVVFFDVTAGMLGAAALVVTWTTYGLAGRPRRWDAAMVALAPSLLLHAFTNWDLAAVALTGGGLLAWARRRPVLAGVLLGLGTATKLYPALIFLPLLALALRARRIREVAVAAGSALAAWLVVDLPVWLAYPASFGRFWSLNRSRGADWDSLWLALEHLRHGATLDPAGSAPTLLNGAVAAGTALVGLGVLALALLAPRRPRLASLAFLTVAGFLLVNKVDSPQYVLWLVPLAVLARPRWGAFLAWQATEALLLLERFYFFVGQDKPGQGLDYSWFLTSVLLRDAALLALMGLVVRECWRPEYDVVRRGGVDDPAGGVLSAQGAIA